MKLCLIGEVVVDVTLPSLGAGYKLRLGGIVHAARCAWALGVEYDLLFAGPVYLEEEVVSYAIAHGARNVSRFGTVSGSPNVMLIGEPTEAGDQGYENLLRETYRCAIDPEVLSATANLAYTDILVIAGGYDLNATISLLKSSGHLHVDVGSALDVIPEASGRFRTLFVSTSSPYFQRKHDATLGKLRSAVAHVAQMLIFKENRGGT